MSQSNEKIRLVNLKSNFPGLFGTPNLPKVDFLILKENKTRVQDLSVHIFIFTIGIVEVLHWLDWIFFFDTFSAFRTQNCAGAHYGVLEQSMPVVEAARIFLREIVGCRSDCNENVGSLYNTTKQREVCKVPSPFFFIQQYAESCWSQHVWWRDAPAVHQLRVQRSGATQLYQPNNE